MKLKLEIRPDLVAMMAAEIAAGERAVSAAMREAGTDLKLAWRGQMMPRRHLPRSGMHRKVRPSRRRCCGCAAAP